jgi:acetyl-CoA synthetase
MAETKTALIKKAVSTPHHVADYAAYCNEFSWEKIAAEIGKTGDFNMARIAIDRHVEAGRGNTTAIRWLGVDDSKIDISYAELQKQTNRFANALASLGIARGEKVFALSGRLPGLYVSALGSLRHGAVFSSLFSAFGPDPIATRMTIGKAKVLVTTADLYEAKVVGIRGQLPDLKHVILLRERDGSTSLTDRASTQFTPSGVEGLSDRNKVELPGTLDFDELLAAQGDSYVTQVTNADTPALLHFTSGTTGKPKGAQHVHGAIVAHYATSRAVLDLKDGEIYWCTADPGWVTGVSYGILGPLSCGVTLIVDEEEFDIERWYSIVQNEKVAVWYTAPTAIRMMMKAGVDEVKKYKFSALRHMCSVGEPLNAEAVLWTEQNIGLPAHDTWWQTETGAMMIVNFASMDIKPGSMGKAVPGVEIALANRTDSGLKIVTEPEVEGEIAIKTPWPSMFRTYLNEEERYKKCFVDGYYMAGDLAKRDADGYLWFIGRADDVIKSSGHLIGPFEVESVLMEHKAVAEAGVIGVPDDVAGELVLAFVSLRKGFTASEDLADEIRGHARARLGAAVAPREIRFMENLPRTRSGKIMRRLLKAHELGLPEGDLSTLEGAHG